VALWSVLAARPTPKAYAARRWSSPSNVVSLNRELVEERGCKLLYPPFYSDLNPVQKAFSKIKDVLSRNREALIEVLQRLAVILIQVTSMRLWMLLKKTCAGSGGQRKRAFDRAKLRGSTSVQSAVGATVSVVMTRGCTWLLRASRVRYVVRSLRRTLQGRKNLTYPLPIQQEYVPDGRCIGLR
jgi:hypothetical protein